MNSGTAINSVSLNINAIRVQPLHHFLGRNDSIGYASLMSPQIVPARV